MKGVGQIGFFSWLLAILVLIFFVGVHFCSNDLNNKNERSLGKERVIDDRKGCDGTKGCLAQVPWFLDAFSIGLC